MFGRKRTGDRDRDLIRDQWPQLSVGQKIKYIFSYYGVAIALVIVGIIVVVFLMRDIATKNETDTFYVMVIESEMDEETVQSLQEGLAAAIGYDGGNEEVLIESGYSTSTNAESEATISTYMQAGRVDLVIAPEEEFNRYAATGYLMPIEDAGVDAEAYDEDRRFYASQVDYSEGGAVTELPFHPHEQTEDSGCYGVYLESGAFDGYVIGAMANSSHTESLQNGILYFLEGE